MPVNAKPIGQGAYQFRFYRDYRNYFECDSLTELREELRAYCPCTTVFRAVARAPGRYTVLRFSPYVIGPMIEGYLWIDT
jgi:hypothetical protein